MRCSGRQLKVWRSCRRAGKGEREVIKMNRMADDMRDDSQESDFYSGVGTMTSVFREATA